MHIVTVVGARPQFIKAAVLTPQLRRVATEYVLHTGQHYDFAMDAVHFRDLKMARPDRNLEIGSGTHARQTAAMMMGIEEVLLEQRPDWLLVYGDTNSTLAAALVGAKLEVPIAHVEAGVRSHDRAMPEEINRVVTDHLASLLFAPSATAVEELRREGIASGVFHVGDIMYDLALAQLSIAREVASYPAALGLEPKSYAYATVHRAENTDDEGKLRQIFAAFSDLSCAVVVPLHPRTKARLESFDIEPGPNTRLIEPLGYVENLALMASSRLILTDSGGVQKEAYYVGVPCVTLRSVTEWPETVSAGWNRLAGADRRTILAEAEMLSSRMLPERRRLYGDGSASVRIAQLLSAARPRS